MSIPAQPPDDVPPDVAPTLPASAEGPHEEGHGAPPAAARGTAPAPAPSSAAAQPASRALREPEGAWLAGVSSGIARHLDWPVPVVRLSFVALACMQLVGVVAYALLWMLMPTRGDEPEAPGLESAQRRGMRRDLPQPASRRPNQLAALGLGVSGIGVAVLAEGLGTGPSSAVFWPLALAGGGLALVWRQADAAPARRRWSTVLRVALGLGLVGVSVSLVAALQLGVGQLPTILGLAALMVLGVGIAAAPWITQWRRRARQAHERALLEQARADMAAHLHDSVLQTLALIQRQAEDPRAVASLARRQERELRAWLYGAEPVAGTLAAGLRRAATEVEDERGIDVELVCVGDMDLDERRLALVQAAREAMVNAAKHSGAERVDVFCEVEDGRVEVFVRDRGAGFDQSTIRDDRMGVRRSIIERMERHSGSARIRSAPGEGTEVRLVMED